MESESHFDDVIPAPETTIEDVKEQIQNLGAQVKGIAKAIGQLKESLAKSVSDVATEQSSHYLSQSNQIAELQIRVQLLLSLVERVSKLESADTTWTLTARLGNLESRIDAYNEHHKKFGYSGII